MWQTLLDKIKSDHVYFQELLAEAKGYWKEDILRVINKAINNEELNQNDKRCFIRINKTNVVRDHKIEYLEKQISYLMDRI